MSFIIREGTKLHSGLILVGTALSPAARASGSLAGQPLRKREEGSGVMPIRDLYRYSQECSPIRSIIMHPICSLSGLDLRMGDIADCFAPLIKKAQGHIIADMIIPTNLVYVLLVLPSLLHSSILFKLFSIFVCSFIFFSV